MTRREFLRISVAGSTIVPFTTFGANQADGGVGRVPPQTPAIEGGPAVPLYKVIFDERFAASVAYARECERSGVRTCGIRGDVTALWYRDLYCQWKDRPAAIAGVTTPESLFCLDLLARDVGMHVSRRQPVGDGLVSWSIEPRLRVSRVGA